MPSRSPGRRAYPQAWLPMPLSMRLLMLAECLLGRFPRCSVAAALLSPSSPHTAPTLSAPMQLPPPLTASRCSDFLQHQQNSHRALVLLGSILVALLPITLAWGYGEMWEGGEPLPDPWRYRTFLPLIWLTAGGAVCGNTWIEDHLFWRPGLRGKESSSSTSGGRSSGSPAYR